MYKKKTEIKIYYDPDYSSTSQTNEFSKNNDLSSIVVSSSSIFIESTLSEKNTNCFLKILFFILHPFQSCRKDDSQHESSSTYHNMQL